MALLLLLPPKSFAEPQRDAIGVGDAELEAPDNAPRTVDEVRLGFRTTNFAFGLLEQLEPTIEMIRIDRQRHVPGCRDSARS